MKILLHAYAFWPQIGGIESVSRSLARAWTELGHQVTVVTETKADIVSTEPYRIVRAPSWKQKSELAKEHDLVHAFGASMSMFLPARLNNKPFSWTHAGYQCLCIDGQGWLNDSLAPLDPWGSFLHHWQKQGAYSALIGLSKLLLRRAVASIADANVAVSQHVANRLSLPRCRVIYDPIDLALFAVTSFDEAKHNFQNRDSSFAFLGRLVQEKGLNHLLYAFSELVNSDASSQLSLKVIGDGPAGNELKELSSKLGLTDRVSFIGSKSGEELADEIKKSGIFVVPSSWEEPGGTVVTELMAAGKPLIVSSKGGLLEKAGDYCLSFPNNDRMALAAAMRKILLDQALQDSLILGGFNRAKQFSAATASTEYLNLFRELLDIKSKR